MQLVQGKNVETRTSIRWEDFQLSYMLPWVRFFITAGQRSDYVKALDLIQLIADRGYDANYMIEAVNADSSTFSQKEYMIKNYIKNVTSLKECSIKSSTSAELLLVMISWLHLFFLLFTFLLSSYA